MAESPRSLGRILARLFLFSAAMSGCVVTPDGRASDLAAESRPVSGVGLEAAPLRWSTAVVRARRAAVLVAADSYTTNPAWALPSAVRSTEAVRDMLVDRCGFPRDAVTVLSGRDVSADRVEAAILAAGDRLRGATDGLLWVYFCGHGWIADGEQQVFTYLTREVGGRYEKTIARGDVVRWMAAARAGAKVDGVLVVDACRRNVGDPPPRARLVRSDVWEVYGVKEGQLVAAGNGGEAFAFTRALADAAAALATSHGDADLQRVVAEATSRTLAATGMQEPEMRPPAAADAPPALVLRNRVRFVARIVDALSGVLLPEANVVFDDQKLAAADGTVALAGSASEHVLSVAVAGYLPRTERMLLRTEESGASLEVPLLPAFVLVRGQVDPPGAVPVRALADGARAGYHVLETTSDARGRFELRVPRLAGTRVDVLQDGKVLVPVPLPAAAAGIVATGDVEGVGVVDVRVALPAGTIARPADAPQLGSDADRIDWDRAQRLADAGRYDLARETVATLRGTDRGLVAWRRWLDSRWSEKELLAGLAAGKERGEWEQADAVVAWWKRGTRDVDNRERIAALVEEVAREHMPLATRLSYQEANRALAEGDVETALARYLAVRDNLPPEYCKQVVAQVERLRLQLYERFMNAGAQAELEGDVVAAFAAYVRAVEHNARARTPAARLLARHPELADSAAGRQIGEVKAAVETEAARIETGIGLSMIRIEAQEFAMGSPENETGREGDETRHRVRITKPYWIGETEVTQGQWREVMGTKPWQGLSYTIEGDAVAATEVSWTDAMEFCRKLTERERAAGRLPEGYRYILPTEAEWELACRAGSSSAYCYGDDEGRLREYAVYLEARSGQNAHAVKQRKANAWGLYDMHGNVWEWCLDQADYSGGVVTSTYRDGLEDPYNTGGPQRVFRGGCWLYSAQFCRSAYRLANEPGIAHAGLGFRPVLAARSDVK
ncbi:MAG: formylglycine-generating enzyme family protein [Planctomycetota bacterium]